MSVVTKAVWTACGGCGCVLDDVRKRRGSTTICWTSYLSTSPQPQCRPAVGINCLHASVGASLGGQQALAVGALFPDRVSNIVSISASARSYPLSIALRYVQRQILMSDPHWNHGDYYDGPYPKRGMVVLRELATTGYRSGPEWNQRFGQRRDPQKPPSFQADFAIEKYMLHKGESFAHTYDPNSILYISKALDLFDLGLRTFHQVY